MANCYCDECENRGSCDSYGAAERHAVEWLRAPHQLTANVDRRTLSWAADAIERGDHRPASDGDDSIPVCLPSPSPPYSAD